MENIKNDLSERELSGEGAKDRVQWRGLIRNIDPTIKWERMRKKKKKYIIPVKTIDQTSLRVCVERKHMSRGTRDMTHAGGPVSTV